MHKTKMKPTSIDNLALHIGRHIVVALNEWIESKEPKGKYLKVPISLPTELLPHEDHEPWITAVTLDMPLFIHSYWEDGIRKFQQITLSEYYGWKK